LINRTEAFKMRHVIVQLPVKNNTQLAVFESVVRDLTLGFCLTRSMSYNMFRMALLQNHVTGVSTPVKCILVHNHFISVEDGIATLYRHLSDIDVPDPGDEFEDDGDTSSDNCKKRRRSTCRSV
jgi:hypothetical protein